MRDALRASAPTEKRLRQRLFASATPTTSPRNLDPGSNGSGAGSALSGTGTEDAASLFAQCLDLARAGDIKRALALITRACFAPSVPAHYRRVEADLLRRCGKFDEAIAVLRRLVEQNPQDAPSWALLADFWAGRNEFEECRRCCEAAIALDPTLLNCVHNLATVEQHLGHPERAETLYREVLRRDPLHLDANLNLAVILNEAGRYRESLAIVEGVLARDPQAVKAYLIASSIEFNMGRYAAALKWIEDAIARAPHETKFLASRASILSKLGRHDLALADCDTALDRSANDADAWRQKALTLRALSRGDESLDCFLKAESLSKNPASVAVDRAWLLAAMGRKDQAVQLLDKTLAAQPRLAGALDCRSFLVSPRPGDADLATMEEVARDPRTPANDRVRLSLSIGRSYLDAGDGETAFRHLNFGNALKRKSVAYDRAAEERRFAQIMRLFSAGNIAELAHARSRSARPIFVFGMPRSGTTLVEQILSSHRAVRGTGETPYLDMLARTFVFSGPPALTSGSIASCAERYLDLIGAHLPAATRFVDKTNSNVLYAGLISLMFPGARMIHCRRNPLDTCLSCYSLVFVQGHEFCYDLAELGHYYDLYRRLAAHWSDVLAPQMLLDIDYESLAGDPKPQVERILEFCGLPWDDTCLRFYETQRLVATSSLDQVRSPIHKGRIGRAERFRPWLSALVEALESVPGVAA